MESAVNPLDARALRQRARFDALRRKIFAELGYTAAKWRLTWLLPFQLSVLALLVIRGEPLGRAAIHATALILIGGLFVAQVIWPSARISIWSLFIGAIAYFTACAVTGALASPLLSVGVLMLVGGSVATSDPKWLRGAFFAFFLACMTGLALFSRSPIGALVPPLTPNGMWSSAEYVTISLMSLAFSAVAVYRMGCNISYAYQRVAFELAERREELCSEGETRTRALEGIAARLAHEVKNPLAAIKGLSTHMARTSSDPKMAERLAIVAAEADRLQAIVDGFLTFSRGLDDLRIEDTRPYELGRELALLLETRAADSGVTLEVRGDHALTLRADGRKLRQALLNLVLNAMQASPRGKTVTIDIGKDCAGNARIRVIDEGIGMTPDVLERIRKPYFTTKEGGSGLGVAVSRGIIEQHGGQLKYDSAPGKGTTVTIELPRDAYPHCPKALPNPARSAAKLPVESIDAQPVEAPAP